MKKTEKDDSKLFSETSFWKNKQQIRQYYSDSRLVFDTTEAILNGDEIIIHGDSAVSYKYLIDQGCVSITKDKIIPGKDTIRFEHLASNDAGKDVVHSTFDLNKDTTTLSLASGDITQWGCKLCLYYDTLGGTINNPCGMMDCRIPTITEIKITKQLSIYEFEKVDSSAIKFRSAKECPVCGSDSLYLDPNTNLCEKK